MSSYESMEVDQVDQTEVQTGGPPWSELPAPVVEKVYSFLNRSDQMSMSLVCRNWRQEHNSPSLWRKMIFRFPDFEHLPGMCPDVTSAWRFGAWFHHVEIVCQRTPPRFPLSAAMRQLKSFLEALTCQSQLLSISFNLRIPYLRLTARNDAAEADFHQMILNFMKSQKRLRSVRISDPFKNAHEIVKALFENNSKTLRHLHTPYFFLRKPGEELTNINPDDDLNFLIFMNLEVFEIHYSSVFEGMVLSFYECRHRVDTRRNGRLKEVRLHYASVDNRITGIYPNVWKYFKEIFPGLGIYLKMDSECDYISLSKLIVPKMPLRTLDFHFFGSRPGHDTEVGVLLRHITSCGINKSFEVLKISWFDTSTSNLTPDLLSFMNTCSELKTLELKLLHPVVGLHTLFNSWLENRPLSLQFVKINVALLHSISLEEGMIYTSFNQMYAPLFEILGISLSVQSHFEM